MEEVIWKHLTMSNLTVGMEKVKFCLKNRMPRAADKAEVVVRVSIDHSQNKTNILNMSPFG